MACHIQRFDHVVVNEDVNRAVHALLTTMEQALASWHRALSFVRRRLWCWIDG